MSFLVISTIVEDHDARLKDNQATITEFEEYPEAVEFAKELKRLLPPWLVIVAKISGRVTHSGYNEHPDPF